MKLLLMVTIIFLHCCPSLAPAVEPMVDGSSATMALKSDGSVWSWGNGLSLGIPDLSGEITVPHKTLDLADVRKIVAASSRSIVLKSDGTIWQIAKIYDQSSTLNNQWPERVSDLTDVIDISTQYSSSMHYVALTSDGTVWAWGDNDDGQIGPLATGEEQETPVEVPIAEPVIQIAAGYQHTIALTESGSVWAWGNNLFGQLGNGGTEDSATPVKVVELSDVVDIASGGSHNLALRSDGVLWAWGNNWFGQLGDGTTEHRYTPVEVVGLSDVIQIATSFHSTALKSDGSVWTWGSNDYGDGTTDDRSTPGIVPDLTDVAAIGAGGSSAILTDGTVWSWDDNAYGQLGDGTTEERYFPVQVIDADGEPFSLYVVEGEDDAYEPDDTHHEATPLLTGESQTHTIDQEGDVDWYSLSLSLSSEVVIEMSGESGEMAMALYDADLETMGSDDGSGEEGRASISLDCDNYLPPGTYWLVVGEADNLNPIPAYDIQWQSEICPEADFDEDGEPDVTDAFVTDPQEWNDNDGDGAGDNADTDDDNDGMPDSYEDEYGFDSTDAADADQDADGDGDGNLAEYQFGSSPTDAEDALVAGCDAKGHYTDVTCHHWAFDHIQAVGETEISRGCGNGDYCPDNTLQRAEMAIFLLRGKYGGRYSPISATGALFGDVTTDHWAGHQIERLAALGITSGCEEDRFCPSREVTRAEMAVFLLRTKYGVDYQPPTATGTVFGDISGDYWAAAFIEQLEAEGAVEGTTEPGRECEEGHFCPSQNITRSEMAVFLNQAFGLDEAESDSETVALIPKTGRTVSGADGDDGDLQKGVAWPDPRFTDNGDGTITDNMTGLVWLQDGGCLSSLNWQTEKVEELNDGSVSCRGYTSHFTDWRMPTNLELQSLLDMESAAPPLPENHPFIDMQSDSYYWSSTCYEKYSTLDDEYYWYSMNVSMGYGEDYQDNLWQDNLSHSWYLPVRDGSKIALLETMDPETTALVARTGQTDTVWEGDDGEVKAGIPWPDPRFTDNGDGTITDNLTTLVWMKNAICLGENAWQEGLDRVAGLNTGTETCDGYEGAHVDWRLPNRSELLSLADYSLAYTGFPFDDRQMNYWTATPLHDDPGKAWHVNFTEISYFLRSGSYYAPMTTERYIWPVRDGS
ncbi:MAG: DUF1566 domain-containing protein [Magnetococcales bacterium]|nr:DUF1566 domain-containing protein [Magnetococcales bacterium]